MENHTVLAPNGTKEERKKRNNLFEFNIDDWKSNPYSCLKARVYIELSSIFAYLTQFTSLTANHISLIYCVFGIIAGVFLASNIDALMIIGLVIFFLKAITEIKKLEIRWKVNLTKSYSREKSL